jgi:hypothetical protein
MNDNKLKIRIQIQQPPHQALEQIYPDLPEPEIVYEHSLDWKKISLTAVLLLIILALIGYFFFNTHFHEAELNKVELTTIPPAPSPENKVESEEIPSESTTQNEISKSLPQGDTLTPAVQSGNAIQSAEPGNIVKQKNLPVVEPKPALAINSTVMPGKKPGAALLPESPKTPSADSPLVLRAQLSHDIKAREPVDTIDTVQLRSGESKSIYFYLHLMGLKGKKVSILWYRDNKLDSQLFLEIHNDNWRTNASKQLDHQRLGKWRVELVDESKNRLAARDFTVAEY